MIASSRTVPGSRLPHPLTIAHRAGNELSKLRAALAAGVDYAEADVWFNRGLLEVRHDRTAVFARFRGQLLLSDLLTAASAGNVLLDLKGTAAGLAEALVEVIERAGARDRVAVCGEWVHLDRLAESLPSVPRFYAIDTSQRLVALSAKLNRREVAGVSIDRRLVTAEVVAELKQRGVETIVAWTVGTLTEGRRLLACGVNGVTSDSLRLLTEIREG